MLPKITSLKNGKSSIAALECVGIGNVAKTTIDLTPYAGERVRIWLDRDGTYSLDKFRDHFWQIAEMDVPALVRLTGEKIGEDGKIVPTEEMLPLDLAGVKISVWPLPE